MRYRNVLILPALVVAVLLIFLSVRALHAETTYREKTCITVTVSPEFLEYIKSSRTKPAPPPPASRSMAPAPQDSSQAVPLR